MLKSTDFSTYLKEQAALMAPGDVETTLSQRSEAAEKAAKDASLHAPSEGNVSTPEAALS